jgi:hypothetical protein
VSKGLLLDADEYVAAWVFATYSKVPFKVDRALGVVENGQLVGAAVFSSFNTMNADLSYYGSRTLTPGIVRALARVALYELRLSRCTVIVPKRPAYLLRKLGNGLFGFRYEGVQRRFYGPTNSDKHTGCRYVLFREDIEKLLTERLKKVA